MGNLTVDGVATQPTTTPLVGAGRGGARNEGEVSGVAVVGGGTGGAVVGGGRVAGSVVVGATLDVE